ncbi:uncharacterized protein LOC134195572 [Corticium candelabrum]|uniref:uncharacterized protein LOC134195572 n=1 Tax=Corticium candelabrum TaxID=121492 RepID=UPI002E25C380|nr:uncharacterized protein LOC134195572 [Corticium candelabrum]
MGVLIGACLLSWIFSLGSATDCMDSGLKCFLDPSCSAMALQLFSNCSNALRTPLSSPPCTEHCKTVLFSILDSSVGQDLLKCNCSTITHLQTEDSPGFLSNVATLCKPVQLYAVKKCTTSNEAVSTPNFNEFLKESASGDKDNIPDEITTTLDYWQTNTPQDKDEDTMPIIEEEITSNPHNSASSTMNLITTGMLTFLVYIGF